MKKALIVGINYYENVNNLYGCVDDASKMATALKKNYDNTLNFDVETMLAVNKDSKITRSDLKHMIKSLFDGESEIALFYFSGHGYIEESGGYIITSDCITGDDSLPLSDIMSIIHNSKAKNKIIILDSCESGIAGSSSINSAFAEISEGTTILTACGKDQYALEIDGHGVFTSLFIDGLLGGASDILGFTTPASVYALIDQSLGSWDQRPVFKANIKNFVSLRQNYPSISLENLKKIVTIFKDSFEIKLDDSFISTSNHFNSNNVKIFEIIQSYALANLVNPINAPNLYYAAINSTGCILTPLGIHYFNLVSNDRI